MIPAMSRGKVYLIGAGPGDPGLIAARGLDCLSRADVVVYDHLVHERLLAAAPAGAERIDVGTAAPQTMAQEAISYLLVEKAREGRVVARLKWGDPFVFDRGGEEALFLHEHGVPFDTQVRRLRYGRDEDQPEYQVLLFAADELPFDLANRGQVLLEFAAVGRPERRLQLLGVAHDEIKDAAAIAGALVALFTALIALMSVPCIRPSLSTWV